MNTENKVTTVLHEEVEEKFKLLKVVEFDSDRKRMTVAVQWNESIYVFVKGADTSITKLLRPGQKYLEFIKIQTREMAKTGLRSLWFAYKTMPLETDVESMEVDELEKGLSLIGATGIEDRLQDYVP